jgi:hypothetical protein
VRKEGRKEETFMKIRMAPALLLLTTRSAGSVTSTYKDARPVLDAGIKAMGGLEALRG